MQVLRRRIILSALKSPKWGNMNKRIYSILLVLALVLLPCSALATTGGNGITAVDGTISVELKDNAENGVGTTSSVSGMEFESGELTLLQGCADGEILKWEEDTDTWDCATDGGSGMNTFTLAGDTGTGQTIGDGNTLTVAGGVGIDTADSATDTVTITFDPTEVTGARTWSDGSSDSSIAWTYDLSAGTDPVITFGNGTVNVSTGELQEGGVAVVTEDRTITGDDGILIGGSHSAQALSGNLELDIDLSSSDGTGSTSSGSGLEIDATNNDLAMLQGCSDGQVLSWNDSGATWDCDAKDDVTDTTINGVIAFSTETNVTPGTTGGNEVYVSLGGVVSATELQTMTPFEAAATFSNLQCVANGGTTQAITAILGNGACTTGASYTSKAQVAMSATANTQGTSSGTTAVSAGECATVRLSVASSEAAAATIHCTVERSA